MSSSKFLKPFKRIFFSPVFYLWLGVFIFNLLFIFNFQAIAEFRDTKFFPDSQISNPFYTINFWFQTSLGFWSNLNLNIVWYWRLFFSLMFSTGLVFSFVFLKKVVFLLVSLEVDKSQEIQSSKFKVQNTESEIENPKDSFLSPQREPENQISDRPNNQSLNFKNTQQNLFFNLILFLLTALYFFNPYTLERFFMGQYFVLFGHSFFIVSLYFILKWTIKTLPLPTGQNQELPLLRSQNLRFWEFKRTIKDTSIPPLERGLGGVSVPPLKETREIFPLLRGVRGASIPPLERELGGVSSSGGGSLADKDFWQMLWAVTFSLVTSPHHGVFLCLILAIIMLVLFFYRVFRFRKEGIKSVFWAIFNLDNFKLLLLFVLNFALFLGNYVRWLDSYFQDVIQDNNKFEIIKNFSLQTFTNSFGEHVFLATSGKGSWMSPMSELSDISQSLGVLKHFSFYYSFLLQFLVITVFSLFFLFFLKRNFYPPLAPQGGNTPPTPLKRGENIDSSSQEGEYTASSSQKESTTLASLKRKDYTSKISQGERHNPSPSQEGKHTPNPSQEGDASLTLQEKNSFLTSQDENAVQKTQGWKIWMANLNWALVFLVFLTFASWFLNFGYSRPFFTSINQFFFAIPGTYTFREAGKFYSFFLAFVLILSAFYIYQILFYKKTQYQLPLLRGGQGVCLLRGGWGVCPRGGQGVCENPTNHLEKLKTIITNSALGLLLISNLLPFFLISQHLNYVKHPKIFSQVNQYCQENPETANFIFISTDLYLVTSYSPRVFTVNPDRFYFPHCHFMDMNKASLQNIEDRENILLNQTNKSQELDIMFEKLFTNQWSKQEFNQNFLRFLETHQIQNVLIETYTNNRVKKINQALETKLDSKAVDGTIFWYQI